MFDELPSYAIWFIIQLAVMINGSWLIFYSPGGILPLILVGILVGIKLK